MFKKCLLLFSLGAVIHIFAMEPASIESTRVPSLKQQCINKILECKNYYTPEQIGQLPEELQHLVLLNAAVEVVGLVPCNLKSFFPTNTGAVFSIYLSRDNCIITGSEDHTVRVWNMQGEQRVQCNGHAGEVWSVCMSRDNNIVSASADHTVRVWTLQGNQIAQCNGHTGEVNCACVTSENYIVSGSSDHTVRVWNMQGEQIAECIGHTDPVWAVCVTEDNKIVSGSEDGTIRIWDAQGRQLAQCNGHARAVSDLCISHDNKIVSASQDQSVRVWDMHGNQLALCIGHHRPIASVCVTYDNKIVSGSGDSTLRIWDIHGTPIGMCKGTHQVWSVIQADHNTLISASHDGNVCLWDSNFVHSLEKVSPRLAVRVWSFLHEMLALLKTGYVEKLNATGCWARIQELKDEDEQKAKQAAEPEQKRHKPGE